MGMCLITGMLPHKISYHVFHRHLTQGGICMGMCLITGVLLHQISCHVFHRHLTQGGICMGMRLITIGNINALITE